MLKRLKERFLGDERTVGVVADLKALYETADDPEAFHAALSEGDIEAASEHHPLSAAELHERIDGMMGLGSDLAEDYPEVVESDPEEFNEA